MTAKEFRPIILKTLKDSASQKFRSVEELADRVIDRMATFEEMKELLGGVCVHTPEALETSPLIVQATSIPERPVLPPPDLSERIMPRNASYSDEEIVALKQRAFHNYQATLPQTIEVQLPGANAPFVLQRKMQNSPGAFSFIRIQYTPQGADSGVDVSVNVTEGATAPQEIIDTVRQQAMSWYSAQPRQVRSAAPPPVSSLEAQMSTGWSVETDKETGAGQTEFSRPSTGPTFQLKDGIGA